MHLQHSNGRITLTKQYAADFTHQPPRFTTMLNYHSKRFAQAMDDGDDPNGTNGGKPDDPHNGNNGSDGDTTTESPDGEGSGTA